MSIDQPYPLSCDLSACLSTVNENNNLREMKASKYKCYQYLNGYTKYIKMWARSIPGVKYCFFFCHHIVKPKESDLFFVFDYNLIIN